MNTPTPLGKQTFAEYEKEVKDFKAFNLKAQKIELKIGDKAEALISKLKSASKEVNSELDSAFTPIRQLESAIDRLTSEIPSKINKFKPFMKALTDLESQFDKDRDVLQKAEQELGVKIPEPKIFTTVSKILSTYQREEETFRKEINEFNKLAAKLKKLN